MTNKFSLFLSTIFQSVVVLRQPCLEVEGYKK